MGTLGHLNGQPQELKMGAFWSLKLLPMVQTSHSLVTDLFTAWSENGHPPSMWQELSGVGILQRLRSERASSKLDLASSESLQWLKDT
jgi:hypothetical protein